MWYDLVVLAILVFATFRGAAKGIVWQLAVIASLVLCFAFSGTLSAVIAPAIGVQPPLNRWIAMFALYVVFSFVSFGAARWLKAIIEKAKFEELDRHLGAVFGLIKGVVFALVLTFFVVTLSADLRGVVFDSYSGKAAAIIMDRLHPVMPAELHDVLEPYIHQLDRPGLDLRHPHGGHHLEQAGHQGHEHRADANDLSHAHEHPAAIAGDAKPAGDATAGGDGGLFGDGLFGGWLSPRRPEPDMPAGPSSRDERNKLLAEIGEISSDIPATQRAIIAEVERQLAGVPDRVALAVIRDWHADLLFFDPANDPDPQTNLNTPLDVRIARQLDRAGVSRSSLSSALQDRLLSIERR